MPYTFLLNNSRFYITIHSLDSDDMKKEELGGLLKGLAEDDGVQIKSEVSEPLAAASILALNIHVFTTIQTSSALVVEL